MYQMRCVPAASRDLSSGSSSDLRYRSEFGAIDLGRAAGFKREV
jgi:hypothetical protein